MNMIIKRLITIFILYFTILGRVSGQSVDINVQGEIYEYATYYVSSFDVATGATNVQITVANGVVQPITWNIGNGQTLAAATGDDSPSESRIQKVSLVLPDSFDTKGVDIVPLVAPVNGFGYDPLDDLPSYYAGVSADLEDTVDGAIPLNVKYRQVSLIANPTIHEDSPGSDYPLHKEAINSLKSFGVVGSTPTTFDFLNNEYLIEQISNSV